MLNEEEIRMKERKRIINLIRLEFGSKPDYVTFGIPIKALDDYLEELLNGDYQENCENL